MVKAGGMGDIEVSEGAVSLTRPHKWRTGYGDGWHS